MGPLDGKLQAAVTLLLVSGHADSTAFSVGLGVSRRYSRRSLVCECPC